LLAIKKQTYSNFEVVIVDGKSSDNSTHKIQKLFPQHHYIYLTKDTGYSGGNNAGIKYLLSKKANYVLSMNNDVIMNSDCLENLIQYIKNKNDVGLVGPRMYSYSSRNMFQRSGGYVNIFRSKPMPKWIKESEAPKELSLPYEVKKLPGALILVKTEAIKKVGLMDEKFFLYYGDTDWQKRFSNADYKQFVVPRARAYHKVSATTGRGSTKVLYYDSRDFLNYVFKHHGFLTLIYSFIKSYIQRLIQIINSKTDNKPAQFQYLNLAYLHFILRKSGKGI